MPQEPLASDVAYTRQMRLNSLLFLPQSYGANPGQRWRFPKTYACDLAPLQIQRGEPRGAMWRADAPSR